MKRAAPAGPAARAKFAPASAGRWDDVAELFGPRGACAGCWCMWPRLEAADFARGKGDGNRRALRLLVARGEEPGILATIGGRVVGWCAVAPRAQYRRLERSRVLKPVDDEPVWSVPCFFVAREFRRQGLSVELLRAAVEFAAARGARVVEGYPVDAGGKKAADVFVWTGLVSTFERAGFVEVARRSPTRPIMRCVIGARAARRRPTARPSAPRRTARG